MKKLLVVLALFLVTMGSAFAIIAPPQAERGDVSLIFECWNDNGDDTYTAYFGYENKKGTDVSVSSSLSGNVISNTAVPTVFTYPASPNFYPPREGRTMFYNVDGTNAFSVVWNGAGNIVWSGAGKTATASTNPNQECEFRPVDEVPEFGLVAGAAVIALAGLFIYKRRSN